MASNINRWMKYARARLEDAVGKGNQELDRLEAEREVDLADRPWLRASGETPSLDEARARIRWETEQADAGGTAEASPSVNADGEARSDDSPDPSATAPSKASEPRSPEDLRADAEAAGARLELEARQRESTERLDAIRAELGIKPPPVSDPREPKDH